MPDNASEDRNRPPGGPAADDADDGPARSRTSRTRRGTRRRAQQRGFLKELPILLLVALLLSFVIQTFIARVYVIPSESMEPTLMGCTGCGITNDRIVVDKVSYRFGAPRPGDVVVFKGPASWGTEFTSPRSSNAAVRGLQQVGAVVGLAPPNERDFVKRVVATGGQTVQCCDATGNVQVNGASLTEPYVVNDFPFVAGSQDCATAIASGRCFAPVTVPPNNLWMMGDNRNNSADSRYHVGDNARGTVPSADVIGKARVIVVPVSRWQVISSPQIVGAQAAGGPSTGGAPVPNAVILVGTLAGLRTATGAGARARRRPWRARAR